MVQRSETACFIVILQSGVDPIEFVDAFPYPLAAWSKDLADLAADRYWVRVVLRGSSGAERSPQSHRCAFRAGRGLAGDWLCLPARRRTAAGAFSLRDRGERESADCGEYPMREKRSVL